MVVTETVILFETIEGTTLFTSEWTDLEKDYYAPDSDTRAMTRLVLKSDLTKNYVFTFRNKEDMNRLKKFIKHKKHTLHEKKDVSKKLSINDIRSELLSKDQKLKRSYEELVNSGILLEEEFWMNLDPSHQHLIDQKEMEAVIAKGRASTLFSDLVKEDQTPDKNPEMKAHIFSMYPAVKLAFEETVPLKMQESEFWTIYLKSDSFRSDKGLGAGPQNTVDLFQRYQLKYEQQRKAANPDDVQHSKKPKVNPDIDLTATSNDYAFKEISDFEDKGRISSTAPVIGKYNKNSTLIAEDYKRSNEVAYERGGEMEELGLMSQTHHLPVTSNIPSHKPRLNDSSKVSIAIKALETFHDVASIIPSASSAEKFILHVSDLCIASPAHERDLPQELAEELKEEFLQVAQLLRHFYARLDHDDAGTDLEKKVSMIADSFITIIPFEDIKTSQQT